MAFDIFKDHHLAEDAVNDAFIRIIDNLDKIDKIDCPQTKRFVVIIMRAKGYIGTPNPQEGDIKGYRAKYGL